MYYKIVGKRWFQRSYGNTYHSCAVYLISGEGTDFKEQCIGYIPFVYGYDMQYQETAFTILCNAGIYSRNDRSKFMEDIRNKDLFVNIVSDVPRKRDL
jgi:hypothetical protein